MTHSTIGSTLQTTGNLPLTIIPLMSSSCQLPTRREVLILPTQSPILLALRHPAQISVRIALDFLWRVRGDALGGELHLGRRLPQTTFLFSSHENRNNARTVGLQCACQLNTCGVQFFAYNHSPNTRSTSACKRAPLRWKRAMSRRLTFSERYDHIPYPTPATAHRDRL